MCPCCVPPAHLTDPEPCRKWCLCQQGKRSMEKGSEGQAPYSECFLRVIQQTLEGDPFIGNRCECCMRKREGGRKEKKCVALLGPKVQGVFLQFLLCYGKDNVVFRLGAVEKAAWQTASSSSSLAPTLPNCLCSPKQRYRHKES